MAITRRSVLNGLAAGAGAASFGMPGILRSAIAQGGSTLKVGMVLPVTGPGADAGRFALNGAKLALEAVNKAGGVLGKPMELVTEDDQTTNPGAVLAFSKLASQPDIVAFLGSIRSTQNHAMAPDILKTAKPVLFGGTDPVLTHMGNPWLFRFRPNDSYSARVIADYGVNSLGKKKWAVIHSTDAFGTSGAKALNDALAASGASTAIDQGYSNQSQDFTPVVLAIKQSGAEVIGSYFTFENDLGIFARQLRQLGVTVPWVGSPSITNVTALKLAGPSLFGTYGVADYAEDSSEASKSFGTAYRNAYKVAPDNQSSWTFDAVTVLALAINKAGKTDPEAIRQAILSVKGHKGAEGEYNFDQNGDGLHGYNIVQNDKGNITFSKRVDFKD
jgi:branched-chain amino acid transport system substrate-binding protein